MKRKEIYCLEITSDSFEETLVGRNTFKKNLQTSFYQDFARESIHLSLFNETARNQDGALVRKIHQSCAESSESFRKNLLKSVLKFSVNKIYENSWFAQQLGKQAVLL